MDSINVQRLQHVDDRIDIDETDLTPIQEFYKDTKIFVTGFTGFLGQILVEKLIRSCPVSTIYVLVRKKKGKDVDVRVDEILDDQLFNRMKKACPDWHKKIVAMEGDCALPELGLSNADKKLIIDEVDIIFHVAATVRFDAKLEIATAINVRATRDLSRIAHQMTKLKSFVQVSTAYCNCVEGVIEEKIYDPPMSYKCLINIAETMDSSTLEKITPVFVGKWPNTYVYTKQIAENVMKQEAKGLPVAIYRPAIVVSTYKEPIRGWINNVYGATGIFFGAGIGLLRVLYCEKNNTANIVPVDMCVNGLIASAWDVTQNFQKAKEEKKEFQITVYNYETSSNEQRINWAQFSDLCFKYGPITPSVKTIWYPTLTLVRSYQIYLILRFFLHTVPAMFIDAFLFLRGKKMRMTQAYKKIHVFSAVIHYFTTHNFTFKSDNVKKMLENMINKDKDIFFCDLRKLDWEEFFSTYCSGARIYLAKDPLETIPEGEKKLRRLTWAHEGIKIFLGFVAVILVWYLLSAIYNYIFI